jgi:hypothetical protein
MLILLMLGAGGYYAYQRWTNPEAVRQMAMTALTQQFPGAAVQLSTAELRLFGGVYLHDLRLTPKQGPSGEPVLIIPEAVLYPDRELLSSGEMVIRKVVLKRPKFCLVRHADGTWNIDGLMGPFCPAPNHALPMIEVQDATLAFHDRLAGAPPLHLVDVHATLTPAEKGEFRLHLRGQLPGEATCTVQGTCSACSGDLQVQVDLQGVPLGQDLQQRLAAYFPEQKPHLQFDLGGTAQVQADIACHPGQERPFTYQLKAQVKRGRLAHPQLPFPLEEIDAAVRYAGGEWLLETCQGKAQQGTFSLTGALTTLEAWHLKGEAKGLQLQPAAYGKLPDALKGICLDYQPQGPVNVSGQIRQQDRQRSLEYTVQPQRLTMVYCKVPYLINDLAGTLQYTETLGQPRLLVHLNGKASGQIIRFRGQLYGEGLRPENPATAGIDITVTAENVPIDDKLRNALQPMPGVQNVVKQLRASGLVDCKIHVLRPAGNAQILQHEVKTHVLCDAHHAKFNYEPFPLPIEQAKAHVEFLPNGQWKFENLEGWHQEGKITGKGCLRLTESGDLIDLDFEAERLPLSNALYAAVPAGIQKAWQHFCPEGRVNCVVRADYPQGKPAQIEVDIVPLGCSITPACFPYLLTNVQGMVQYAGDTVLIRNFSAKHNGGSVRVAQSKVAIKPNGGFHTELTNMHLRDLLVDEDLLAAVPPLLAHTLHTLRPDRPLELVANLVVDLPSPREKYRFGWNGQIGLTQCKLHTGVDLEEVTGRVSLRGTHDGQKLACTGDLLLDQVVLGKQPFRQVSGQMVLGNDGLTLQEMRAALHGGRVDGILQVSWADPLTYEVAFRAEQLELEEFARQTLGRRGQARGKVNASMNLKGQGNDLRNLKGKASLKVEQGAKLYDLPLVFELLNHLSSKLPQGTLFQDASAELTIDGERIGVRQLELVSEAITLRGQGDLRLDGSQLNLEMYGLPWGRRIPLLPPIIDKIPPAVSKQLMKIRAKGSLTQVKIIPEPVPIMVEPLKEMFRHMTDQPSSK